MIKKTILALVCLLAPLGLRAQNVVVSGNVKDVGVANATGSNTFVRFTLIGYGPTIPRVITSNVIANPVKDFHPDSSGNIHGLLQGNETITPAGTNYQVCIFYQGTQFRCATYNITGLTFDLPTAVPITSPPPSTQLIYGAKTYLFTQSFPALTWVIPHHFGDRNVIVQCTYFATPPHVLYPDSVALTDNNTVTVTFTTAQSGTCLAMSGGSATFTTSVGDAVIKNPNAAQTLNGQDFNVTGKLNATGGGVLSGGFVVDCVSRLNSVFTVGGACANYWGGGDIGAQINTAYAALGASGGEIDIACPLSGGSMYNFTTPIALSTSGKFPNIVGRCASSSNVQLNYTPSSGTAIMADWVPIGGSGEAPGSGFRDFALVNNNCNTEAGCGGTAVGIKFGGVNFGAHVGTFANLRITGFATGVQINSINSWGMVFTNCTISSNAVGLNATAAAENNAFIGGRFAGNGTAVLWNNGGDLYLNNMSIDQSVTVGINVSNGTVHLTNPHFENETLNTATTSHFITASGTGWFEISQGYAIDDVTSGTSDWLFQSSGYGFYISGLTVASAGRTETAIVSNGGTSRGYLSVANQSTGFVTALVGGAAASSVTNCSINLSNGNPAQACSFEQLKVGGGSTINAVYRGTGLALNSAFTSIAAQTCQEQTVTLTGASTSGIASVSPSSDLGSVNLNWSARVSGTDTVTVRICNPTVGAITPSSVTWAATVIQ